MYTSGGEEAFLYVATYVTYGKILAGIGRVGTSVLALLAH
jgi:hypothetical protein